MNIEDIIKAFGPIPQAPQVIPIGNKNSNGHLILIVILIGGIGYLIYREWKRKSDLDKKYRFVRKT
jgi:hypothetical protein